jgi:hypothetical protein
VGARQRFRGRIAGVGSTSGVRVVVGWWHESPFGPFADAMVERADGHRLLVAPTEQVAALVSTTYVFDEIRVEPVEIRVLAPGGHGGAGHGGAGRGGAGGREGSHLSPHRQEGSSSGERWQLTSPSMSLTLEVGGRMPLGRLLRLVPGGLSASPAFATVVDPVARVVLRGVRTRGQARAGRREYYGAGDIRAVTSMTGVLDGIPLGDLRPVDPPCRFGFSSTPRAPAVTDVVTTIIDT